ncbi:tetratricopeptide repeat protein [Hymenobacter busanensis]|uniref:Tetratricopeptide repeat protein n=1 Tax=Hymenobacter busanensis TaxID=2607656 RepID=A0A7L4ZZX8_9BACT|nr:tetratricopeptide repeat protein [Hymenobacter busanensis]KAA9332930.1 tetratricopeptide repeat protein [Hymenobacter busanensis]QHJ08396.1 tetratricopeptide repeat protein [Hymenobacter busanensis]
MRLLPEVQKYSRWAALSAALLVAGPVAAQVPGMDLEPAAVRPPTDGSPLSMARYFARRGEWLKAEAMFEELPNDVQQAPNVLPEYLRVLVELKKYKDAEKLAKKALRRNPNEPTLAVALGSVYAASGDTATASKQYSQVLARLTPEQVVPVATEFQQRELPRWVQRTYLRGRELAKNDAEYSPQLVQLYTRTGNTAGLLSETLRLVDQDEQQLPFVRNMLQNSLRTDQDFDTLEKLLLTRAQQQPDRAGYAELLLWLYLQRRDFTGALVQARALDRRQRTEGSRVMDVAAVAQRNKDYDAAIEGYQYVSREYRSGQFGQLAQQRVILAREEQVRNTFPVDKAKLQALVVDYQQLLTDYGRTAQTAETIRNLALLYAFQLDDKQQGMKLLQEVIDLPRADATLVDEAKIALGDIYLLRAEPWEATLLYSQVEKSHKDSPLGYEAKLRNARLSYFAGDFKLAQSHLDILKLATSREIANDAMQLSLLIGDNTAMDTAGVALRDYAAAELLVFQNKLPEAQKALDALLLKYPGHALTDESWYLKAQLQRRMGDYAGAVATLQRITENPKYDILSDDALYLTAQIEEENRQDRVAAQELYTKLLIKYPGSIYVADARKHVRKLRGDAVPQ